ncbi:hypothetical protein [Streptomyces zhihengii]|uniref:hypothetical protein n=1 Tax=Streptomyces zhihengii TaxID=1818004 RepID=UPI0033B7E5EA
MIRLPSRYRPDPHGNAIDPTWADLDGAAYRGITLPPHLRPRPPRHWGVLQAPHTVHPLLRGGLPGTSC